MRMSSPARGRVLVIDDEAFIGRGIQRVLANAHDVDFEVDSARGLARASSERYDVILCDLSMPGMSGIEIYEALTKTAPETAKRMVFLTGGAYTDRATAFLESVENVCLEKPVGAATLNRVVKERMR